MNDGTGKNSKNTDGRRRNIPNKYQHHGGTAHNHRSEELAGDLFWLVVIMIIMAMVFIVAAAVWAAFFCQSEGLADSDCDSNSDKVSSRRRRHKKNDSRRKRPRSRSKKSDCHRYTESPPTAADELDGMSRSRLSSITRWYQFMTSVLPGRSPVDASPNTRDISYRGFGVDLEGSRGTFQRSRNLYGTRGHGCGITNQALLVTDMGHHFDFPYPLIARPITPSEHSFRRNSAQAQYRLWIQHQWIQHQQRLTQKDFGSYPMRRRPSIIELEQKMEQQMQPGRILL